MQLEIWAEDLLQHGDIEEVPADIVVLRDGISEIHTLVVCRPINPSIIEQMRKILVQELHQMLVRVGGRAWFGLAFSFLGYASELEHTP